MPAFLSDEWFAVGVAEGTALPTVPGASIRLQQVVTGGPEGEVRYLTVIDGGRTVEQRRADAGAADTPAADVTITTTYADAVAIQQGALDINTGFMQGRVKVAGNMAKLLDLLPLASRTEWRDVQARIAAATDFPD